MQDALSQTLSALADPTRRAILARLGTGDASVAELAQPFNLTPQAISKHVGVLERAGLVSRRKSAQRHLSHLEVARLREVDAWMAQYRQMWETRMDNIAGVIDQIRQGTLDDPRK